MTRIAALLAAALLCASCANTYRGAAIEGWVVDADTKQPLEGVIVVIMWELEHGGFHPGQAGALFRREAVTDSKGHFGFPAWGPLKPKDAFLSYSAPYIALFKRGYLPRDLPNAKRWPTQPMPEVWDSEWNGKTVPLQPFHGSLADYGQKFYSVEFLYGATYAECDWEMMPKLTAELLKLGDECAKQNVWCGTPNRMTLRGKSCREPPSG
jgi:hypothetical protein